MVTLPPDAGPGGNWVSPIRIVTVLASMPSSSAATTAIAVRKPVPRSWQPLTTSTEPSRWTLTCAPTSGAAKTYQTPFATPMPRLSPRFCWSESVVPAAALPETAVPQWPVDMSPAFWFRRSQPMALAPGSYWLRRTGLDSFFFRNSSGSIPTASASSSIADSMPNAPCEWPGARSGACGPAFVKTSYSSGLKFGLLWYIDEAGPAVPAPVPAPAEP